MYSFGCADLTPHEAAAEVEALDYGRTNKGEAAENWRRSRTFFHLLQSGGGARPDRRGAPYNLFRPRRRAADYERPDLAPRRREDRCTAVVGNPAAARLTG